MKWIFILKAAKADTLQVNEDQNVDAPDKLFYKNKQETCFFNYADF